MKRISILIVFVLIFCFLFTGCSIVDKLQADKRSDKPQGEILGSDARQFVFEDNTYTILNQTVERNDISTWIGITGSWCFLNKDYKILKSSDNFSYKDCLTGITKEVPTEAYYMVQFGNIYRLADNKIAIGVDGEFYVAKLSDSLSTEDTMIEFETLNLDGDNETDFCINSENARQLLYGDIVYTITETSLPREDKGKFLQVIGTQVVFDVESGQVISKSDYEKVEITPGKLSKQNRKSVFYGNVYEIKGIPESEAVMVEINSKLMRAESEK